MALVLNLVGHHWLHFSSPNKPHVQPYNVFYFLNNFRTDQVQFLEYHMYKVFEVALHG